MPCPWTRYLIDNVTVYVSLTWGFQRRARFQPNLFHHPKPKNAAENPKSVSLVNTAAAQRSPEPSETINTHRPPGFGTGWAWDITVRRVSSHEQHCTSGDSCRCPSNPNLLAPGGKQHSTTSPLPSGKPKPKLEPFPAVQEVWFAGCHSDVGGGSVEDTVRYSLGDISLRWMVKQVVLSRCGIRFDAAALRRADIDISTVLADPTHQTLGQLRGRKPKAETGTVSSASQVSGENSSKEDLIPKGNGNGTEEETWPQEPDVLADIHDELESKLSWYWLLEFLPTTFTWQKANGDSESEWGYELTERHPLTQRTLTDLR